MGSIVMGMAARLVVKTYLLTSVVLWGVMTLGKWES
jgi:hypothetical protein